MGSDAAADSGPAAECCSTGASMVAPALGNGCCCTRRPGPLSGHRPQLGPVMLIETVRVLVGWSDAGPRPHLVKSYLSDTFQYRGETIKGATPPLPPLALPPLKVFIGHNSNFGRTQF